MSDKKHRLLMTRFIATCLPKDTVIDTEVPYNHYGIRGFVDIVSTKSFDKYNFHQLYELKTNLNDVGEAIRQVKKQEKWYKTGVDLPQQDEIMSYLVLPFTKENVEVFLENTALFKSINLIWFFPEEGKYLQKFKAREFCSLCELVVINAYTETGSVRELVKKAYTDFDSLHSTKKEVKK